MADLVARAFGTEEGVTLEQLVKAGVEAFGKDESELEEIAQRHGFPPGRFEAIAEAWKQRMARNPAIVHAYNRLYQRAMEEAGVEAPDLSLEEYASIIRATGAGTPLDEAIEPFGMDVQQFSMLSQRMGERMMRNPSLAIRYAQLISAGHQHAHGGQSPPEEQGPSIQILS